MAFYKYDDNDIATYFDTVNLSSSLTLTGFQINGTDLARMYTPLGVNSNLSFPQYLGYTRGITDSLNDIFEFNIIDKANTTCTYEKIPTTNGLYIKITGTGTFKYRQSCKGTLYLLGGGGGGGGQSNGNAGGGGGGGELVKISFSSGVSEFTCTIGGGGGKGTNGLQGINGGVTKLKLSNGDEITARGGGGGGRGFMAGVQGGSVGGSGSAWPQSFDKNAVRSGNNTITIITDVVRSLNIGGHGSSNSDGGGGGGGGCGAEGQNADDNGDYNGGNGGAGLKLFEDDRFAFGGGGGGGGGYSMPRLGGRGTFGGGTGGQRTNQDGSYSNGSDASNYGGGGGGAPNINGEGGNGFKGIILMRILDEDIVLVRPA